MEWTAEQLAELESAYTDLLTGRNKVRLTLGVRTFEFGPGDAGRLERLIAFFKGESARSPASE